MHFVTFERAGSVRIGAVREGQYVDLHQTDSRIPASLKALLALGADGLQLATAAAEKGTAIDPAEVRLLAPIPDPGKVICIGLNYADHAAETGAEIPSQPVVFCKFPTAVSAHGDAIVLPASSSKVDYEAELVVVIGQGGKHIPEASAMDHVAGYACGHDVSARDWQKGTPGGQWLLGKTFDTFAPFGPEMITADEIADPGALAIELRLNGQTMQKSSTSQLIFSVPQLIAHVSSVCTLEPGDVIFTGTPPGVGAARKPPIFLQPGDVVEVEIEGLGLLRNPVEAEPAH
ncbi:fumarylacetoacetate hydrolase family protein [Lignipirellula cremea]|uniref:Ureidoglycolate lyase n=1 Tax=Lignipirellula cremea TaxID=2528010 RepID=A0A518E173_9BACT|nr:fumarylacetoacetate hydrolase family protein [Lignipirellula cremea]QDU97811.1 Ureidoglycolate lyase [Lignipirellula cremea]